MEDLTFFHQYPIDSLAYPFDNFHSLYESDSSNDNNYFNYDKTTPNCFPLENLDLPRPTKKIKTSNSCSYSSPQLISFEPLNAPQQFYNLDYSDLKPKIEKITGLVSQGSYEEKILSNYDNRANQTMRNSTQAQEHVMAERKRREKLTRSFIALSALVPGLKKMDKASVLGDAIKYVKQLKERLQSLEEQGTKKKAIIVKRSFILPDDNNDIESSKSNQTLPEIEVRVSAKDVLIKIQCDKENGLASTLLGHLQNHNLTLQTTTFLPFGNNILDITILAQMNKENCVTAKDLIGSLRKALLVHN
ncbi:transcription factor bHLH25-like [Cicer arietinum]|uniref:Transcription factor bHLH18-like n=1 Tax=Cicer arietinum TaxID=3827 RepID=A0A1S2YY59_CICAR|nr:transcription factor bHLH18-like [Cicer arietinum]